MGDQLWAKGLDLDQAIHRFTVGDDPVIDLEILPYDCIASAAHARTLQQGGYLSDADADQLVQALHVLYGMTLNRELRIQPEQEDGHTAIEAWLVEKCGEAGRRIHLGRSRNDQVTTAVYLWMRDALGELIQSSGAIAEELLMLADQHQDTPLPGYTHLRRAMPSSWAQWAGGYAEIVIEEAFAGLAAALDRALMSPLGTAAGYGAPVELDRAHSADLLGFNRLHVVATSVQASRGRVESGFAGACLETADPFGRLVGDLIHFTTEEFAFVSLPDSFTTGSSIMPQKRNPDVLELLRGKLKALDGPAAEIRAIRTGLTGGYHRDFQLLKAPLMTAHMRLADCQAVLATLIPRLEISKERCAAAMSEEMHAAASASILASDGLPFRDAYQRIGKEIVEGTYRAPKDAALPTVDLEPVRAQLAMLAQDVPEPCETLWENIE